MASGITFGDGLRKISISSENLVRRIVSMEVATWRELSEIEPNRLASNI